MIDLNYLASTCECSHLLDSLKGKEDFELAASDDVLRKVKSGMDKNGVRRLDYVKEKGPGTWFATTPSFICGTFLSALKFRDELRDRYGLEILNTPSHCDGCNSKFSSTHIISCKVGDLIHSLHDESRNTLGCLACAGFQPSNVRDEPHINPCRDIGGKDDVNKIG